MFLVGFIACLALALGVPLGCCSWPAGHFAMGVVPTPPFNLDVLAISLLSFFGWYFCFVWVHSASRLPWPLYSVGLACVRHVPQLFSCCFLPSCFGLVTAAYFLPLSSLPVRMWLWVLLLFWGDCFGGFLLWLGAYLQLPLAPLLSAVLLPTLGRPVDCCLMLTLV